MWDSVKMGAKGKGCVGHTGVLVWVVPGGRGCGLTVSSAQTWEPDSWEWDFPKNLEIISLAGFSNYYFFEIFINLRHLQAKRDNQKVEVSGDAIHQTDLNFKISKKKMVVFIFFLIHFKGR